MSKRDDTKYWRDLNNKSLQNSRLDSRLAKGDINRVLNFKDYHHYFNDTGLHCIGTGMGRLG